MKHLPLTEPFSVYLDLQTKIKNENSINDNSTTENGTSNVVNKMSNITNQKLLEAIDSVDALDKMYMALSTRAIKSYDASGRSRAALSVHGDIAALK